MADHLVTSRRPIHDYLSTLRLRLWTRPDREEILAEVEDHLREVAERLAATGQEPTRAETEAIARFGDPELIGRTWRDVPVAATAGPRWVIRTASAAASAWVVSIAGYVAQARWEPWSLSGYQLWCRVAAVVLVLTAVPLLHLLAVVLHDVRRAAAGGALLLGAVAWQAWTVWGWLWVLPGLAISATASVAVLGHSRELVGRQLRRALIVLAVAWPTIAVLVQAAEELRLGPLDSWGSTVVPPLAGYGIGGLATALALVALAYRLRGAPGAPQLTD